MTDPRTRLLLVLATSVLSITLESPLALGLLTGLSAMALVRSGLDPRWWKRVLGLALIIIWSTVLSQSLFYGEQPRVAWLQFGPLTLWREGIIWGLVQSLRLLSVGLAGVALAVSTPPDRIFAALIRLRVPFALAFMAVTALRFVPQVGAEIQIVHRARAVPPNAYAPLRYRDPDAPRAPRSGTARSRRLRWLQRSQPPPFAPGPRTSPAKAWLRCLSGALSEVELYKRALPGAPRLPNQHCAEEPKRSAAE